jgi:hypothetical protein
MKESNFDIHWIDAGCEPQDNVNPKYPDGIDVDISGKALNTCIIFLPYPAPRVGVYQIWCKSCGLAVGVAVTGRADDPRSVRIRCKKARETIH